MGGDRDTFLGTENGKTDGFCFRYEVEGRRKSDLK